MNGLCMTELFITGTPSHILVFSICCNTRDNVGLQIYLECLREPLQFRLQAKLFQLLAGKLDGLLARLRLLALSCEHINLLYFQLQLHSKKYDIPKTS